RQGHAGQECSCSGKWAGRTSHRTLLMWPLAVSFGVVAGQRGFRVRSRAICARMLGRRVLRAAPSAPPASRISNMAELAIGAGQVGFLGFSANMVHPKRTP